jgi:hypothetical protein
MTRWSVVISEETDKRLRSFLAKSGGKKDDISRFVEQAVQNRLRFMETVQHVKDRNADTDPQEIMDSVEEAVAWSREDNP